MHYKNAHLGLNGERLNKAAKRVIDRLEEADVKPACIIMRGMSGMAVGMVVAAKLGCKFAVVRKLDKDGRRTDHGYTVIQGDVPGRGHLVIVDDFISSGKTLRVMAEAIKQDLSKNLERPTSRGLTAVMYQQQEFYLDRDELAMPTHVLMAGTNLESF